MRKLLLLALPLAALLFVTGCNEEYQASSTSTGAATLTPADAAPAAAPAQTQSYRRTTTQPLPQGASYIHAQDLSEGPLAASQRSSEG